MINRKISKKDLVYTLIIVIVPICVIAIGLLLKQSDCILVSVMFTWSVLVIKNLRRERLNTLVFLFTFFSFLLGTLLVYLFDKESSRVIFINYDTQRHIYCSLYIALLFFDFGSTIARIKTPNISINTQRNDYRTDIVAKVSKFLFIAAIPFTFLLAIEKIAFVWMTGQYTSYYVDFASVFPSIFGRISSIGMFSFYIFLATLPNPSHNKLPLLLFWVNGLLGILYGQRNQVIIATIFIVVYCVLYENHINKPYSIIKKRTYVVLVAAIPLLLIILEAVMYFRDGNAYQYKGFFSTIQSMLNSLGDSSNTIGYGYECEHMLPPGKIYSLGGVINFFKSNIISQFLFGTEAYQGNTLEMALYGDSFGQTITYYGWGSAPYLAGRGMGSCYIAEAYHDFGYLGVMAFSFVYGFILSSINRLQKGNIVKNTILLMSFYYVIYAPRDSAGNFISCFFNFSFLLTIAIIYLISLLLGRLSYKKDKGDRQ